MKAGFRQSMAWVHTWGGLLVGWVLFFMFLTGTLGYFDTEIDRWMKPELPVAQASLADNVLAAQQRLGQQAPVAERWFISLPTSRDIPNLRIFWQELPAEAGERGERDNEILDAQTALPVTARASGGGQTLYQMHYALHYLPLNLAYWLVGICSMFMMVAIVTGIIIHKKIFKDFFTFRPRKGQRSWLDMHNVLSVVALPFHIMITYSGLIFFAFTYMPLIVASSYGWGEDAEQAFFDQLFAEEHKLERANTPAPLASLTAMVRIAEETWGEGQLRYLDISHPGDAHARVAIGSLLDSPLRASAELVFDGVSGELLTNQAATTSVPRAVRDTLLGLHEGLFAGPVLRWLYFFSGLLGTAMIATGMILWTVKRSPQQLKQANGPDFGFRLVESLNLGTMVGLPMGIAAYFWVNRLLPIHMETRAAWEVHTLFLVWLAAMLYPLVLAKMGSKNPSTKTRLNFTAWIHECWAAAAAFALLPIVNAMTTDRHLLNSLPSGDWIFAGFDLTALVTGLLFAGIALKLHARLQTTPTENTEPQKNSHSAQPPNQPPGFTAAEEVMP